MNNKQQFLMTDTAIRQSLITLLKTKPFEKITIQNILDEASITRSTFYKHYRDKYDILEQMQEELLTTQNTLINEFFTNPTSAFLTAKNTFLENREIVNALLSVHTDKIDLRHYIATDLEKYYLEQSHSPDKQLQAKIFAQMITELRTTEFSVENISLEHIYDTLISVLFTALCIPEDHELREQIKAKSALK